MVVGGGVAGLLVAWEAAAAGRRTLLLEAGSRLGGAVTAHRVGGLAVDAGADSYALTRPAVTLLIADLALDDAVVAPNPVGAWVRHRAGAAPLPANGLLGIPSRPWTADVRRVIGLAGAARASLDRVLPAGTAMGPRATLGSAVRGRLGSRVLERLVRPVAGGVYSADPSTLEMDTVTPGLRAAVAGTGSLSAGAGRIRGAAGRSGSAVAGLHGGMNTLTDALTRAATAAGAELRTGAAVRAVRRDAAGWVVDLGSTTIAAAAVVLAVPGGTADGLLAGLVPDEARAGVAAASTPVRLATLVVRAPELHRAPRGTGVLVAPGVTGVRAKALTHATAKWSWLAERAGSGVHVLRLSYGRDEGQCSAGSGGPDLPDPADLPALALADAADLLGVPLRPGQVLDTAVVTWESVLPAPRVGQRAAVARLRAALAALGPEHPLAVTGTFVAGTGLAATVADARETARRLLDPTPAVDAPGPAADQVDTRPAG
ncbi:protoporphyrinogen oxidase [Nakamurella flavida]